MAPRAVCLPGQGAQDRRIHTPRLVQKCSQGPELCLGVNSEWLSEGWRTPESWSGGKPFLPYSQMKIVP